MYIYIYYLYLYIYISNIYIYIYIYVSMYLCIYVSMYLCIYVSMYLCLCIYVSMYLCIYVSMYLCIYVSMYLCTYIHTFFISFVAYKRSHPMCSKPKDPEAARTGPRDLGHLQSFRAHRDGARNHGGTERVGSAGIFSSTWLKLNYMGNWLIWLLYYMVNIWLIYGYPLVI